MPWPSSRYCWGFDTARRVNDFANGELDPAVEATDGSNLVAEAVKALGTPGTCAMVGGGTTLDLHLAPMHLHAQGRPLDRLVRRYPFTRSARRPTTAMPAARSSQS